MQIWTVHPYFALVSPTSLRIMAHDCGNVYAWNDRTHTIWHTYGPDTLLLTLHTSLGYTHRIYTPSSVWSCLCLAFVGHVAQSHAVAGSFAVEHAYDEIAAHSDTYAPVAQPASASF